MRLSRHDHRPLRLFALAVVSALTIVACQSTPASRTAGETTAASTEAALIDIARASQTTSHFEYRPLGDWSEVVEEADLVALGEIIDVRQTFIREIAPGVEQPYVLFVVRPSLVLKGADSLGNSGLVHLLQPWSPASPIEPLASRVSASSDERVLLVLKLDQTVEAMAHTIQGPITGRGPDDLFFSGRRASAILGIQGDTAFPLFTDEPLEITDDFVELTTSLGIQVSAFAVLEGTGLRKTSP